ncbi:MULTISPECIES: DUF2889 domain-containing protein [unclassified Neptuniibacter]|jgi:hypothetical protein|uniref:DUF2889 domain-containing protein n=1 Tax=unclassified Neptuniibacter TaxID=2630693 RepID=UPI0025FDE825|nr:MULTISPECIES: DUF2889 domain-containing protein [unclassified Neptuniibacter]|tara:strand:- start:5787 stop:6407 length:621 start_codon:yes stop_codon:yes gene_type:complete
MPLPTPSARSLQHTRRVICEGFKRDDGLWDIEAHLIDTKTFPIDNQDRQEGVISPGEPFHGMSVRITIDMELNIKDAVAVMDYTPFNACKSISDTYKQLIGLQIAKGFTRRTKELFSGHLGCTHLLELLGPLATTAFQATHQEREKLENYWQDGTIKPPMLDTCHTLASHGPVVKELWPHFHESEHSDQIIATLAVESTTPSTEFS